jgi:hypothetical protein
MVDPITLEGYSLPLTAHVARKIDSDKLGGRDRNLWEKKNKGNDHKNKEPDTAGSEKKGSKGLQSEAAGESIDILI